MCYNCTHILADYKVKKPFKKYNYYLCNYCEWEIKHYIFMDGLCMMYNEAGKLVKLTKDNIKERYEYEKWLDSCT